MYVCIIIFSFREDSSFIIFIAVLLLEWSHPGCHPFYEIQPRVSAGFILRDNKRPLKAATEKTCSLDQEDLSFSEVLTANNSPFDILVWDWEPFF